MAASSNDGKALEKLRRMISLSTTFQSETGGGSATAVNHVYYGSIPQISNQAAYPRPLAMIGITDHIQRLIEGGNQNHLRERGALWMTIIRNLAGGDTSAEYLAQLEWMSAVLAEIGALSATDDSLSIYLPPESHLNIVRIDMDAFGLVDETLGTTLVQFYGIDATVWWGDEDMRRG